MIMVETTISSRALHRHSFGHRHFTRGAKPTELRNFKLLTAIVSFFHLTKRSMHPEKKKKKKRKKKKEKKVKKVSGVMSFFAASNTLYPRWISPHSELM